MKLKWMLVLPIALPMAQAAHAESFFSKGIMKLAKVVGKFTTPKISTLDDAILTGGIGSNSHSDKVQEASQSFFGGWKSGGDAIAFTVSRKNASGLFEIDGTVTIDGKPLNYITAGTYGQVLDASPNPRRIEIVTKSGQKSAFTIEPCKKEVKLLAINGVKAGDAPEASIPLDLSKDVSLDLSVPAGLEGSLAKISITVNQLSIKSFVDVVYAPLASHVVIPAGAFRNLNLKPASTLLYSFKEAYLSIGVESMEKAKDVTGPLGEVKYTASRSDGKFIKVTSEPNLNMGLAHKGKDKELDMDYNFFKPNAFLGRPFSQLQHLGLKSFAIRGTTYKKTVSTSTSETSTTITTTTTTTIMEFPKQSDATWDALLEGLYPAFTAVIEEELGTKMLPVDAVTKAPSYNTVKAFAADDSNTTVQFSRSFRGTKVTSAFMPVTSGFGADGVDEKVMTEAGADGLLSLTLDLEISNDGVHTLMIPRLGFDIVGKTHGPLMNTKFATGTIASITGVTFAKDIDMAGLEAIIRKSSMVAELRKGLVALKVKEQSNGDYEPVWNFQNPQSAGALGAR